MNIGYVGLGVMGGAIARRLLLARSLTVFDINPEAVVDLVEAGATAATGLSELAHGCDVILICVPRSADVRQIIFSDGGLLEGLTRGKILVDQTSGDPSETRQMAAELCAHGIDFIDAPVSGGVSGAAAGTIAIMVGGANESVDRVRSVFEDISPNITHCGDVGSGQVMKLINNTISTCNRFALLEGVAMGVKNGLRLDTMSDVLNRSGARSRSSEMLLPAMIRGESSAIFSLALMLKDLTLANELALESAVPLQFGELSRDMLQAAADAFGPNANIDDIVDLVAQRAGVRFGDDSAEIVNLESNQDGVN